MASLSDYLESGLLHHLFRGESFPKPTNIAIALCSGVPAESCDGNAIYHGGTLPELPSGDANNNLTGYARINLGNPSSDGDGKWSYSADDLAAGSGIIKNASSFLFDDTTCLLDTTLLPLTISSFIKANFCSTPIK